MLHIKDIEAFARINEALAHSPEGSSFGGSGDGDASSRHLMNPALAFARLGAGMMAPPSAFWPRPAAPADEAASDTVSDEDEAEAQRVAATTPSMDSIPLATAEVVPFPPRRRRDGAEDPAAHAPTLARPGYDFDLMPARPMTAFFNRFFFRR